MPWSGASFHIMTSMTAAGSSSPAAPRPDARTERWRAHREQVRGEFVDAAFRALAEHGPDVSMDDIARAAGCAKPKLYRHFADKTDLYLAILERVQSTLWERVLARISLTTDTLAHLLHTAIAEYVAVVEEQPDVFRFLVHSRMAQQAEQPERAIEVAQRSALLAAQLIEERLAGQDVDTGSLELTAYAIFGAVGSATDWWLGANRARTEVMSTERFAEHVSIIAQGMLDGVARLNNLPIDVDQPVHLAFRTE